MRTWRELIHAKVCFRSKADVNQSSCDRISYEKPLEEH